MTLSPNPFEQTPKQNNEKHRYTVIAKRFGKGALAVLGFAIGSAYAVGDKATGFVKEVGTGYMEYEYGVEEFDSENSND